MEISRILLSLAVVSNVTAYAIYLRGIFKNTVKPHAFTFLVWSLILSINFLIQIFSGVGIGSILLATNLLGCGIVFICCIAKGYDEHDNIDIACLVLGILAIILWVITKTPLYAAILSCVIDVLAFTPSFRKSFRKPGEDSAVTFFVSGFEYLFSIPAYKVFSFLVLLYPVCVLSLDFGYAIMIVIRRMQMKPAAVDTKEAAL